MAVRKTHVVPTHLHVPETVLVVAGLRLSVRHCLLLLVGLALGYQCWSAGHLLPAVPVGIALRWGCAALPVLLSLALAFVSLTGRTLDRWGIVVLRYLLRPRRLCWRSIRVSEPRAMSGLVAEEA